MDKNTFLHLMGHPEDLNLDSTKDLETLVSDYPYLNIAQTLLAVAYSNQKSALYDDQLKKAACTMPNRDLLRRYVIMSKLCHERNQMPADLPDEFRPIQPNFFSSVEIVEDEKQDAKSSVIREKMFIIPEINLKGTHEELSAEMALLEEKRKSLEELKEIVANRIKELEEEKLRVDEPVKTQKKLSKKELIDKFISENPSISRPKTEFFNPISVAQNSIIDQESIVSETLANVYIKQGYIEKAISVYEKLSLKYPEKSVYFAAIIEDLKNSQTVK